ncbi:hypothetical protein EMIT0P218_70258 [Pseudomonas sp. IT-P218]|jgi:hypothetical protein
MTTAEMVVGSLCGIPLTSLIIGDVWILYVGYTKCELLLECFQNSSSSFTNIVRMHTGSWGRLQLVGSACGVLTLPSFYIKHGILSADDFENFPRPLKRKLIALQWSTFGSFASLELLITLLKSGVLISCKKLWQNVKKQFETGAIKRGGRPWSIIQN